MACLGVVWFLDRLLLRSIETGVEEKEGLRLTGVHRDFLFRTLNVIESYARSSVARDVTDGHRLLQEIGELGVMEQRLSPRR